MIRRSNKPLLLNWVDEKKKKSFCFSFFSISFFLAELVSSSSWDPQLHKQLNIENPDGLRCLYINASYTKASKEYNMWGLLWGS